MCDAPDRDTRVICPGCASPLGPMLQCGQCGAEYASDDGIPILLPPDVPPLVRSERTYWNARFARDGSIDELRSFFLAAQQLSDEWGLRSYVAKLLADLEPRSQILEVACGVGSQALPLALYRGHKAVLTDVAERGLALNRDAARAIDPSVAIECYVADAACLPFADESFDAVLLHAGLHHLSEPAQAFREMSRCLRRGGVMALGFEPNRLVFAPIRRIADWMRITERHTRRFVPGDYSVADDETPGFYAYELLGLVRECELEALWLDPVWYCTALTYHLPALSSVLIGKELQAPPLMRSAGLWLDQRLLSRAPGLRQLCLAWSMGARKT